MPFVCTVPMHSTVQTRHSTHQSHPSHLHHHHHHHHHHHPQLPLTSTDHRVRHTEESHQVNQSSPASSSTDPTHHCPPNPPPKPTAVIESKLPPTPTRSVPWPSRLTPLPDFTASQKHWPSQKARTERKHSVYVNAAIYPLREQPQPQNGGERTLPVGSTSCTPPTSWTHLLPYRTSTVPQNLSERLKKSETLPNDVWVHSQRPNSNNEQQAQPYSPSATMNTITDQCARQNSTDGIPVGLKSPPPRPPIRTSSQQLAGRTPCVVQSHARRPNPSVNSLEETSQLRKSAESHLSGLLNNEQTVLEDSPILCRYSQLYSLSLKPEPGERPRSHLKNSANHSESPASTRTTNSGTRLESQMQKLRLRTEDLS